MSRRFRTAVHLETRDPGAPAPDAWTPTVIASSSAPSGGRRLNYRSARAALRAQRLAEAQTLKAWQMQSAAQEHTTAEEHLQALAGVLKARSATTVTFEELTKARGPYSPRPFVPRPYEPDHTWLDARVSVAYPAWPWGLMATAGSTSALTILDGSSEVLGGLGLVLGSCAVLVARQIAGRGRYKTRLDARRQDEHHAAEDARQREHEIREQGLVAAREREEAWREKLRRAIADESPEPLAAYLARELSSAPWPLPIAAELDFNGITTLTVEVMLPELDDVPEERTSLTQRGKLSRKAMPKRDRIAIYEDLCCGVALRLVHEAFRALHTLTRVSIRGVATAVDAAGHDAEFIALTLDLERVSMSRLNLDQLDPSTLVSKIGRWGGNKKGTLSPVMDA